MSIVVRHDVNPLITGLGGGLSAATNSWNEAQRLDQERKDRLAAQQQAQNDRMLQMIMGLGQTIYQGYQHGQDQKREDLRWDATRQDRKIAEQEQRDWITQRDETNFKRKEAVQLGVAPENLEEYKNLYGQMRAVKASNGIMDDQKEQVLSDLSSRMDSLRQPMQSLQDRIDQSVVTNPDGSQYIMEPNGGIKHIPAAKQASEKPDPRIKQYTDGVSKWMRTKKPGSDTNETYNVNEARIMQSQAMGWSPTPDSGSTGTTGMSPPSGSPDPRTALGGAIGADRIGGMIPDQGQPGQPSQPQIDPMAAIDQQLQATQVQRHGFTQKALELQKIAYAPKGIYSKDAQDQAMAGLQGLSGQFQALDQTANKLSQAKLGLTADMIMPKLPPQVQAEIANSQTQLLQQLKAGKITKDQFEQERQSLIQQVIQLGQVVAQPEGQTQ
jgi:hypothetical protein